MIQVKPWQNPAMFFLDCLLDCRANIDLFFKKKEYIHTLALSLFIFQFDAARRFHRKKKLSRLAVR